MPLTFREKSTGREIAVDEPGDPPVRGEAARARRIARFDRSPDWERVEPAPAEPAAKDVRGWAKAEGIDVPARGKLPDEIVEQYKNAHAEG